VIPNSKRTQIPEAKFMETVRWVVGLQKIKEKGRARLSGDAHQDVHFVFFLLANQVFTSRSVFFFVFFTSSYAKQTHTGQGCGSFGAPALDSHRSW